jgi:hypothetical protein
MISFISHFSKLLYEVVMVFTFVCFHDSFIVLWYED